MEAPSSPPQGYRSVSAGREIGWQKVCQRLPTEEALAKQLLDEYCAGVRPSIEEFCACEAAPGTAPVFKYLQLWDNGHRCDYHVYPRYRSKEAYHQSEDDDIKHVASVAATFLGSIDKCFQRDARVAHHAPSNDRHVRGYSDRTCPPLPPKDSRCDPTSCTSIDSS